MVLIRGGALVLVMVSCWNACAPGLKTGPDLFIQAPSSPHGFVFEDHNLQLQFEIRDQRHFWWRFKNKSLIQMEIDHRYFQLVRAGDEEVYMPWGLPKDPDLVMPPIVVRPGEYVALSYPVQPRSPFLPWRVDEDGAITLNMVVRWGRTRLPYRLLFPKNTP